MLACRHTWIAALAVAACKATIDSDQVERAIAGFFARELGPVERVDCPDGVEARTGVVFTCTIHFAKSPPLTVRATHDESGNGHFTLPDPVVATATIAPRIARWIQERTGVDAVVDCGEGVQPIPATGYPCTATHAGGAKKTIVVRKDPQGELTWDVRD